MQKKIWFKYVSGVWFSPVHYYGWILLLLYVFFIGWTVYRIDLSSASILETIRRSFIPFCALSIIFFYFVYKKSRV